MGVIIKKKQLTLQKSQQTMLIKKSLNCDKIGQHFLSTAMCIVMFTSEKLLMMFSLYLHRLCFKKHLDNITRYFYFFKTRVSQEH